ncbi:MULTISPECIES: ABC transporter permease [unclassified Rhodococcus (in: high G+C Gram-positive bacteria)]|uniref:ABC transporter permease n=1 Tax=unclassified Rhodococcus (in: high G+C Gram-positive bacteria) TaxID=192944 RepID=UPI001594F3DE|nr:MULTISPECIES: iron ABC transporter permease [unclassified Rhodococcus (in: high G+C Gram-positive bacteria)]
MSPRRMSRSFSVRGAGLAVPVLIVVGMYALPFLAVILGAFRSSPPGQPGGWSLSGFTGAFTDTATYSYLANSLVLAVGVGITATTIAVAMCWVNVRTNARLSRLVTPLMFIVLATPGLFFALSWALLGTPRAGLVNKMFDFVGLGDSLVDIGGGVGVWFVLSLKVSGLAYFMLLGSFRRLDSRIEEASQMSGASRTTTFFLITLPLLLPSILGVLIVALVIGVVAFEMPLIIGLPSGFRTFSTQIYSSLNDEIPPDYAGAASLALVLIAAVLALIALKWRILDRRSWVTVGGKGGKAEQWDLGRGRWIADGLIVFFAAIAVVLPAIQLVLGSLQPLFGVEAGYSLTNYRDLLVDPTVGPAVWNTVKLSVFGGLIAVTLSLTLGIVGRHASRFVRRSLELTTWLPWAVNGIILGLGLSWAFLAVSPLRPLFGTSWILLIGLVIVTTPLAARTIDGALAQVSIDLEEAARISGAGAVRSAIDIVFRLVVPSFLAGWLITAIHIAGDLEVPVLLSTPQTRTMSVLVYRFYSDGNGAMAAALFCLFLAAALTLGAVIYLGIRLSASMTGARRQSSAPSDPPTARSDRHGPSTSIHEELVPVSSAARTGDE